MSKIATTRKGTLLVHSQHGLMRITGRHHKPLGDKPKATHIELETVETDLNPDDPCYGLTVVVPAAHLTDSGLRQPVDFDEAEDMLEMLTEPAPELVDNFARRTENWRKALKNSNDPWGAVNVLRSINRRIIEADRLSPSERVLQTQAERAVTAEIAASTGRDTQDVRRDITQRLEQAATHYTPNPPYSRKR